MFTAIIRHVRILKNCHSGAEDDAHVINVDSNDCNTLNSVMSL